MPDLHATHCHASRSMCGCLPLRVRHQRRRDYLPPVGTSRHGCHLLPFPRSRSDRYSCVPRRPTKETRLHQQTNVKDGLQELPKHADLCDSCTSASLILGNYRIVGLFLPLWHADLLSLGSLCDHSRSDPKHSLPSILLEEVQSQVFALHLRT